MTYKWCDYNYPTLLNQLKMFVLIKNVKWNGFSAGPPEDLLTQHLNWINLLNTLWFQNHRKKDQILHKKGRSFQQVEGRHCTRKLWWQNMSKLLCCQMGIVIKHFRRLDWLSRVKGWNFREKKIFQLMLEFLKGPFLVQHFSCYTLMTFLMMLSVILLYMLIMLLSTINVIRHLICGNN